MTKSRRRRRVKWFLLLGVLGVLGIGLGVARWYFHGERLTRFITGVLFEGKIKGRVEVDGIDWPFTDLFGRKAHGTLTNLRIYDPRGVLIVNVPRATATIDWWKVALPPHDVVIDELVIEGGCALITEYPIFSRGPRTMVDGPNGCPIVDEDYPLGAYGPNVVGFLDAFAPRLERIAQSAGSPSSTGPIVQIRNLTLQGTDLQMVFYSFRTRVDDITTSGMLQVSLRDQRRPELVFETAPKAPRASLDIAALALHFDLVDVDAARFAIFPSAKDALQYDAKVKTVAGADLHVHGKLYELFQPERRTAGKVDMVIDGHRVGPDLERVLPGLVRGEDGAGRLAIAGSMSAPLFSIRGRGVALAQVPFVIDRAEATIDTRTTRVELATARLSGLGGRVSARGTGSLTGRAVNDLDLDVISPLNVAPYLPADLLARVGSSRLDGRARLRGVPGAFLADQIDVTLGELRARGSVRLLGDEVRAPGLQLDYLSAQGEIVGAVRPTDRTVNLTFRGQAPKAAEVLRKLGFPAVAEAAEAKGTVTGRLDQPVIAADVAVKGAPLTTRAAAHVTYRHADRQLDVAGMSADPLAGSAGGTVSVTLGPRPRVVRADLWAEQLDLAKIPGTEGLLTGRGSLTVRGHGTPELPQGSVTASAQNVTFARTKIGRGDAVITFAEAGGRGVARIEHLDVGGGEGGSLHAEGTVGVAPPHPLDLKIVRVDGFPLRLIPAIRDNQTLDIDGKVSLTASVGGTVARPRAEGALTLASLAVLEAVLGGGQVKFAPLPDGRIGFQGKLFQGKLTTTGAVSVSPPALEARVEFNRVDLAEFLPWLGPRLGAEGWASGYLDVRTHPDLRAELHVQRVKIDFEGLEPGRRTLPLTVENRDEIVVVYDGKTRRATFQRPMRMASATGEFTVTGFAGPDALNLTVVGDVQLGLLEFFTHRYVDRATGNLKAYVTATGTPKNPRLAGTIAIQDAVIRQREQEMEVKIPQGLIVLTPDAIKVPDNQALVVDVDGQTLTVSGEIGLKGLRPDRVAATLQGRVAGKLLEIAFPRVISNAGGSAEVSLAVRGPFSNPTFDGTVNIDKPLSFIPRALRREIVLRTGRIRFTNREIRTTENVVGAIDESRIVLSGAALLSGGVPTRAAIDIDVDSFTYKSPDDFEVELAADLRLGYDGQRLSLEGKLDVLDGRFVRKIVEVERLLPTRTAGEKSEPFWAGQPLLANMRLHLDINTTGTFRVDNDLAKLPLSGRLTLEGTPPHPELDGIVRSAGEGTVRIPLARTGDFSVTAAEVTFSPVRTFPEETPDYVLRAETPFTDLDQNEHLVQLEVRGSGLKAAPNFHLSTNTGLNEAQTLLLITSGRSIQELRARLRGDTAALERSQYSTVQSYSSAGSFSDEIIKKVSGDVLSLLLEDSLRSFTGLDCARVAPGFESVQFNFCKKLGQVFIFTVDYEQGYQGWLRFRAALNLKAADDLYLVVQRWDESRVRVQDVGQSAWRFQLRYRLVIP